MREFEALKKQYELAREWQATAIASLRADLHNTSAKTKDSGFQRYFEPADFTGRQVGGIEERVEELIEQGYTRPEAAALASMKQSKQHNLFVIDQAISGAHKRRRRA